VKLLAWERPEAAVVFSHPPVVTPEESLPLPLVFDLLRARKGYSASDNDGMTKGKLVGRFPVEFSVGSRAVRGSSGSS